MSTRFVTLGVFAHPDDEVICAGGMLALSAMAGEAHCRFLGYGVGARGDDATIRLDEMREAAKVLGLATVAACDFPDQRLHLVPEPDLCRTIEEWVDSLKPEMVITHAPGDVNQDHRVVSNAVMVAVRRRECVRHVYGGEGDFMKVFNPVAFKRIGSTIGIKVAALKCYKSETRDYPDARSEAAIHARAAHYANRSLGAFAEAFEKMLER